MKANSESAIGSKSLIQEKDFLVRQIRNLVKFLLAKASHQVEEEENKTGEASGSDAADFLQQLFEENTGISSSFLTETMLPTVTGMIGGTHALKIL